MKKILAILLAVVLMLSLSVVAFAAGDDPTTGEGGTGTTTGEGAGTAATSYDDATTITITKKYTAVNGGVSPEETFSFSDFTTVDIKENKDATWPEALPTITSITYAEGAATADGTGTGTATATITLPEYTAVGIYTYSFSEVTPTTKTAGVTYKGTTLYLVVTVIEQNGKVRVAAVHCEGSRDAGTYGVDPKTDVFENKYESGTLAVSKEVTGKLGDKSKYFDVTVTFAAASGETINSTIKYTGGKYAEAVTVTNNTATIQVKDGDTVTFSNIPEGVTWTVAEADYKDDGYTTTYDKATDTISAGDEDTCKITNDKDVTPDTGITLDNLPYILIGAVVLAALVVMILRRRRSVEE